MFHYQIYTLNVNMKISPTGIYLIYVCKLAMQRYKPLNELRNVQV